MWDETLIESGKNWGRTKTRYALPLSFLLHGMLTGLIVGFSYWYVEAVPAPVIPPAVPAGPYYISVALPSGGGGPAAASQSAVSKPVLIQANDQARIVPERSNVAVQDFAPGASINTVDASGSSIAGGGPGTEPGTGSSSDGSGVSDQPRPMTAEIHQPVLLRRIEPTYPPVALRMGLQGIVILEAVISKKGSVENLTLLSSAGPLLDNAAMAAVKQWIYRPATLNNRPVSVYFRVTVRFRLE
jgi:protein TonB